MAKRKYNNEEKNVENAIKEWVRLSGWIAKRLNSGSIYKKTGSKVYKIQLEDNWTTDLVVEINSMTVWTEVKKDYEEYEKWLKLEKRFLAWEKLPKSYKREEDQIVEKYDILNRWGKHILTYSLQDFINKLNNYFK